METLTLTLVQPDLQWQQAAENREILGTLLKNHAQDTDLIILPEMFTSAFTMDAGAVAEPWPGESVDWMLEIAVASNAAVTGSIAVTDDNRRYNRLVFCISGGRRSLLRQTPPVQNDGRTQTLRCWRRTCSVNMARMAHPAPGLLRLALSGLESQHIGTGL